MPIGWSSALPSGCRKRTTASMRGRKEATVPRSESARASGDAEPPQPDRTEQTDGQHLPTEEQHRDGRDQPRRAEGFVSISRKAAPHLCPTREHSADGDIGRIEEIGREAGVAENARQLRAIMQRGRDGAMSAQAA